MSLTARLHIEGHSNEDTGSPVLSCDFGFAQEIGANGAPISHIRGGIINLSIRGIDDPELLQWMIGENSWKNGRIVFSGVTSTGPGRTILFNNAYLVKYQESFTNQNDIVIQLTISAERMEVSGVNHMNMWVRGRHND